MSDIQVTIQPTSNVSVEVTVPSNTVRELHIPVVPKITVVENASVTYQSGTNINGLEDVPDVSFTSLTDGQILGYDSDTQSWVNVDQSSGVLESSINITNGDDAFDHMTTPIAAGTSFEAILRDMLEMYNRTTITLQNIRVQLEPLSGDDSYGSEQTLTSGQSLEVGRKLKVNGFRALVGDPSQTINDSMVFLQGNTVIESGFSDGNQAKTLATPYEVAPTTAAAYSFKARVTDDGGPNLGDEDITSTPKTFTYKYLAKLGASSTSEIADNDAAQTLYDGITEQASALVNSSSWNNVDTTADGNSQSNYTYIIFPATFGALQNVVQDNALSVLSAFTDLGDFTINNKFGASISYSFYRTNQTAAFSTGTELDITF